MSGVTKNQFKTALQGGVELSKPGVAELKPTDLNGDGITWVTRIHPANHVP